ncbi:DUF3027 domain-containing protein [Microbacterium sp. NPDC057407]|uniref:DUF3027 domain-containing protein n=1 Tax=Microbacterium sp. NPDC057407 TaxID=3346120 RepID=UPI00366F9447
MNSTPDPVGIPDEETSPQVENDEAAEGVGVLAAPIGDPDPSLLEAHDLALAALREITPAPTIGDPADYRVEADGVVSLRFHNRLAGYPGWFWTVSLARVDGSEPTVLEVELLPGDDALLAPEWVPWAVRLAEYQAAQTALAEAARDDLDAEVDDDATDLDDVDDLDAADFDDDGSPILHAGDVDGVDIDELDASAVGSGEGDAETDDEVESSDLDDDVDLDESEDDDFDDDDEDDDVDDEDGFDEDDDASDEDDDASDEDEDASDEDEDASDEDDDAEE